MSSYRERDVREFKEKRDVYGLIRVLQNFLSGYTRSSAAQALGELGDQRAVDPLIEVLQKRGAEDWLREAAAKALGKIGDQRAVAPLIEVLQEAVNEKLRQAAAKALGKIKDPRAVDPLIAAFGDKKGSVIGEAQEAVKLFGDAALESLVAALSNPSVNVRRHSVTALGDIGVTALDPIISALKDKDSAVRRCVVDILGGLGDTRAVEPLTAALMDENKWVGLAAFDALGKLVTPSVEAEPAPSSAAEGALERLISQLSSEDMETAYDGSGEEVGVIIGYKDKIQAAKALGALGDPRAVPKLCREAEIHSGESEFVKTVMWALGEIGSPSAVRFLLENLHIRPEVEDALGKIARRHGLPPHAVQWLTARIEHPSNPEEAEIVRNVLAI